MAIDVKWTIENNLPVGKDGPNFPHSLQRDVAEVRAEQSGRSGESGKSGKSGNAFRVLHHDGSEGFYFVEVEAQRVMVPYRSPFEHKKPVMEMETATVAGPSGQEVYTDELNRVKVLFPWERDNLGDENASTWVRVMQSDTGDGYGGVHQPRIGEHVLIGYISGDCDRPFVLGRLYAAGVNPNWHSNGILSGFKSKEYGGSGYNQLVMDDATGQNRTQLYSSSANSHLHLGYLIDHTNNTRGSFLGNGFDLKSDACGAVRAGKGLYVTTHPGANQPMDASSASSQLVSAESVIEALSEASVTAKAESLDEAHQALKAFTDATKSSVSAPVGGGGHTDGGGTGKANQFQEPIMLFASPSGIGLSTQGSTHVSADAQVNLVSGKNTVLAVGKSLIASVKEKVSLFVQNGGMKLFAAKGAVEIQAQSNNVEIAAQQAVKIIAATANIEISAKQEILLSSGGAYIRIAGGNIEIHAPAKVDVKGGQHSFSGPAKQDASFPSWTQVDGKDGRNVDFSG